MQPWKDAASGLGRSTLYVSLGTGESMQLQKQTMHGSTFCSQRHPGDQLEADLRLESLRVKTNPRFGRIFSVFDGDQSLSLNSELRFNLVGSIKWLHIQ